jgi:hypothetical protein
MMRALLRLYPAAWRERYGEEFLALLDDQKPSLAMIIDVLFSALDAHLDREREGRTMLARLRTAAPAAIVTGAALWLLTALATAGAVPGGGWVLVVLPLGAALTAAGMFSIALVERGQPAIAIFATLSAVGLIATAAASVWVSSMGVVFADQIPWWLAPMSTAALLAQAVFALLATTNPRMPRLASAAVALSAVVLIIGAYLLPTYSAWSAVPLPAAWLWFGLASAVRTREVPAVA